MKAPVMATNASSSAFLKLNGDGSVDLVVSGTEMGQGSRTALAQVAAEALGMPVERISTSRLIDTAVSPYEWQSVGSTTTWKVGQAIRQAADQLVDRLKANAALRLGIPQPRVGFDGEELWDFEAPDKRVRVTEVALNALHPDGHAEGGPVAAFGSFTPSGLTWPDEQGRGRLAAEWTFGCQGAVVEVDRGTGEIRLLKLVTAMDVGKVVNPLLARGQVAGAMVQSLGAALMEQVVYGANGAIRNPSLTDYKIPTGEDLEGVELEVIFLETPFDEGPFGARCLAEHGAVSLAPAVANAVRQATGAHLDRLPLNADAVLAALHHQEHSSV
jgi:carbon-monoxide dehydrogenase large subunit